jgi:hypothetical protein
LNTAKKEDWQNLQDWQDRVMENPSLNIEKPIPHHWEMRGFNHELSSERITVEQVLRMLVQHFGILWKAIEYHIDKAPTIFCVMCKLHNICMDRWLLNNPTDARLGRYSCAESPPFSNYDYLWSTFDISVGLDDSFEQPSDDVVISCVENRF